MLSHDHACCAKAGYSQTCASVSLEVRKISPSMTLYGENADGRGLVIKRWVFPRLLTGWWFEGGVARRALLDFRLVFYLSSCCTISHPYSLCYDRGLVIWCIPLVGYSRELPSRSPLRLSHGVFGFGLRIERFFLRGQHECGSPSDLTFRQLQLPATRKI